MNAAPLATAPRSPSAATMPAAQSAPRLTGRAAGTARVDEQPEPAHGTGAVAPGMRGQQSLSAFRLGPAATQTDEPGHLPRRLHTQIAQLSGIDLSDVRVHLQSPLPEQLDALAYAHSGEIHVAPGQEAHLPHEAWHLVQQRQGRVHADSSLRDVRLNDSDMLEREADEVAVRSLGAAPQPCAGGACSCPSCSGAPPLRRTPRTPRINGVVQRCKACKKPSCKNGAICGLPQPPKGKQAKPPRRKGAAAARVDSDDESDAGPSAAPVMAAEPTAEAAGPPLASVLGQIPRDAQDLVTRHLGTRDLASLSAVSRLDRQVASPLRDISMMRDAFGPPNPAAEGLAASPHIAHMDTSDRDPSAPDAARNPARRERARRRIVHLHRQGLMVSRSMNRLDAAQIGHGAPLVGKGRGDDIAAQVAGETDTGLISAAEIPGNKFASGSTGHVGILTQRYQQTLARQRGRFPHTVAGAPTGAPAGMISHEDVMEALTASPDSDQRNAAEIREVLFRGELPLANLTQFDGGFPQPPNSAKDAAAPARAEARAKAKQSKASAAHDAAVDYLVARGAPPDEAAAAAPTLDGGQAMKRWLKSKGYTKGGKIEAKPTDEPGKSDDDTL